MRQYVTLIFLFLFLTGCSQWPSGFNLEAASSGLDAGNSAQSLVNPYESQALAILQTNCTSCHQTSSGPSNVYDLLDPNHLVATSLVVPGNPNQSLLFTEIQSGSMPPSGSISSADKATIQNWIAAAQGPSSPTPTPAPGATPTPTPGAAPSFATIETQIFAVHCTSCHSSQSAASGYSFDTYNGVMKGVNLSNASGSLVYTVTQSGSMPPRGTLLSSSEESLLLAWIKAGALQN